MSSTVKRNVEHIGVYTPHQVYDVGSMVETLPTDVHGFKLTTDEERIIKGTSLSLILSLAKLEVKIDGVVTECNQGEHVRIEGEPTHGLGSYITLDLEEDEVLGGTNIAYEVGLQRLNWTARLTEHLVGSHLDHLLPNYTSSHRSNVVGILENIYSIPKL